ncbi:PIN domain-containing protein [Stenotrophomonas pigmentata]|uniref:PIN domain-containing protein n=1 Tax=Stenotrophomonas pigmentata TaxID=3055080 RepID=UPI0026EDBC1B|nr:PIN domain-containing protein [Stenotrophomonas sp. 610A2]
MQIETIAKLVPVENRRINYVLVDHENVQPTDLNLLDREDVRLWVFVGAAQTKLSSELAIQMQAMRERADYVRISGNGSNALDFHIAFYIGQLAGVDPRGFFHIISKDTGFDPLVQHLKTKKILACRSAAVGDMPLFKPVLANAPVAPAPAPAPTASVKKTAKAVTIVVEKAPPPVKKAVVSVPKKAVQAKAMTAAEKLARMKELLTKAKSGRPGSLAALKKHIAAHFQNKIDSQEVEVLIAGLKKAGTVKVVGTKVVFS